MVLTIDSMLLARLGEHWNLPAGDQCIANGMCPQPQTKTLA